MSTSATKTIQVTNTSGFFVKFKVLLDDATNLNHDFIVADVRDLNTIDEMRIFYKTFNQRSWNLNEFIFLAVNNSLCVSIFDDQQNFIVSYGTCTAVVIPPNVVSGNAAVTLPTSSATLNSTASAGTYSIVSTLWTQVSGPNAATIATPNNASTVVSGLVGGTYVFNVAVNDGHGNIANATATVTVNNFTTTVGYLGVYSSDPYTALQTSDTLTYRSTFNIGFSDSTLRLDFNFSEGTEEWYVVKVPASIAVKNNWYANSLNYGTLPDSVWRQPFVLNGFRYYVTRSLVDNPGLPYIFS
jgi:hypothetical protein